MPLTLLLLLACFAHLSLSLTNLQAPRPPYIGLGTLCDLHPSCSGHCVPFSFVPRTLQNIRPSSATLSSSKLSCLLCLLICGDVEPNPGPVFDCIDPCYVCDREVADNHHDLLCEVCSYWSHRSCVNMSVEEYFHWANIDDGWVCPKCNKEAFPFYNTSHLSSTISLSTSSATVNTTSQRDPSLLKILSFNARSLIPKIDYLRGICLSESFDVIVVTETWLSLDILDSEVGIPGYSLA